MTLGTMGYEHESCYYEDPKDMTDEELIEYCYEMPGDFPFFEVIKELVKRLANKLPKEKSHEQRTKETRGDGKSDGGLPSDNSRGFGGKKSIE